jgi:transcriptional regulator
MLSFLGQIQNSLETQQSQKRMEFTTAEPMPAVGTIAYYVRPQHLIILSFVLGLLAESIIARRYAIASWLCPRTRTRTRRLSAQVAPSGPGAAAADRQHSHTHASAQLHRRMSESCWERIVHILRPPVAVIVESEHVASLAKRTPWYRPVYTREESFTSLVEFVKANSFCTLISINADSQPVVSHVPLTMRVSAPSHRVVGTRSTLHLYGHLSKANRHWRLLQQCTEPVLAIFNGPHGYVSPMWYEDSKRNVPTWNYSAVHCRGIVTVWEDAFAKPVAEKLDILHDLTTSNESARVRAAAALSQSSCDAHADVDTESDSQSSMWTLDSVPPVILEKQMRSIVFFDILVTSINGKFKLSQNKTHADQQSVVNNLHSGIQGHSGRELADLMRNHCPAFDGAAAAVAEAHH